MVGSLVRCAVQVSILCRGRELQSEVSLYEVNKSYWKKGEPVCITYCVADKTA